MQNHLVIFARVPRLGTGKRRLAAEIGRLRALQFQKDGLWRLLRRVGRHPQWVTWLALTPQAKGYVGPYGTRSLSQPKGNLGQRMASVMRNLPPGPVLLIGSDIPDIQPQDIQTGFRALAYKDVVFGPARDGGYWAVGLRRRPRFTDPFANVRWSTPHALDDTLGNLTGRSVGFLRTLQDIDSAKDLEQITYQRGRP